MTDHMRVGAQAAQVRQATIEECARIASAPFGLAYTAQRNKEVAKAVADQIGRAILALAAQPPAAPVENICDGCKKPHVDGCWGGSFPDFSLCPNVDAMLDPKKVRDNTEFAETPVAAPVETAKDLTGYPLPYQEGWHDGYEEGCSVAASHSRLSAGSVDVPHCHGDGMKPDFKTKLTGERETLEVYGWPLPADRECDCGAETTGKWANKHTYGCASLKETTMDYATLNVVQRVLAAYGSQRDDINDSDLDDEQPLSLQVHLTLGDIRKARMMVRLQGKNPADFRVRP